MLTPLVASLLLAGTLDVGATAPDFIVQDTDGNRLQLTELLKRGPVVLAFFPKAFTGG